VEPYEYRTTVGLLVQLGCALLIALLAAFAFATGDDVFGVFMVAGFVVVCYLGLVLFAPAGELSEDGSLELRGPFRVVRTSVGDLRRIRVRKSGQGNWRLGFWMESDAGRTWIWNCPSGRELIRRIGVANPSLEIPSL
jgi:hypothetical protein